MQTLRLNPGVNNMHVRDFGRSPGQDWLVLKVLVQLSHAEEPRTRGHAMDCLAQLGLRRAEGQDRCIESFSILAETIAKNVLNQKGKINFDNLFNLSPFELILLLDEQLLPHFPAEYRTLITDTIDSMATHFCPHKWNPLYVKAAQDYNLHLLLTDLRAQARSLLRSSHPDELPGSLQQSEIDRRIERELTEVQSGNVVSISGGHVSPVTSVTTVREGEPQPLPQEPVGKGFVQRGLLRARLGGETSTRYRTSLLGKALQGVQSWLPKRFGKS